MSYRGSPRPPRCDGGRGFRMPGGFMPNFSPGQPPRPFPPGSPLMPPHGAPGIGFPLTAAPPQIRLFDPLRAFAPPPAVQPTWGSGAIPGFPQLGPPRPPGPFPTSLAPPTLTVGGLSGAQSIMGPPPFGSPPHFHQGTVNVQVAPGIMQGSLMPRPPFPMHPAIMPPPNSSPLSQHGQMPGCAPPPVSTSSHSSGMPSPQYNRPNPTRNSNQQRPPERSSQNRGEQNRRGNSSSRREEGPGGRRDPARSSPSRKTKRDSSRGFRDKPRRRSGSGDKERRGNFNPRARNPSQRGEGRASDREGNKKRETFPIEGRKRKFDDNTKDTSKPSIKRRRFNKPGKGESERNQRKDEERDPKPVPEPSTSQVEVPEDTTPAWIRCSPSDLYFSRDSETCNMVATKKMQDLTEKFEMELVQRAKRIRDNRPKYQPPPRCVTTHTHHHHHGSGSESSSSSDSDSDSNDEDGNDDGQEATSKWMEEIERKKKHPYRLHEELWFNEPGEMNDGPLCRCSLKSQKTGIRHNKFPGEKTTPQCVHHSNNADRLFHYRITMSPSTNFLTKTPTLIEYDNHEYIFEGFSMFSHYKLENIPTCKVIRFSIEYTIHFFEETSPENYTVQSLDLFSEFLFTEILELVDVDWKGPGGQDVCNRFHVMPRFARALPDNGKEILSMNEVLNYLQRSSKPLLEETEMAQYLKYEPLEWQDFVDEVRGMIVTSPGSKPSSVRIDQLDRQQPKPDAITYPLIIHFGVRPAQLSYAGDPNYQKMWKQYVKYKHLLNSKPKIVFTDKQKLLQKEKYLQDLRNKSTMKREVTVELSSEGFTRTGIRSDVCQHAMLLPVLMNHLRFHCSLTALEKNINYSFKDRSLLQLALTHTSYKVNYGTNPDHVRNSLSNCGIRQLEYGDRQIHYVHTRKRGINILFDIMSRMGHREEMSSEIPHNERLEFLGDAVVEFISSIHLFLMFPWLGEGGLSTYRAALVQNQHLAVLAKTYHLQDFLLYAHGPDLCRESDLKHAMANCFEALMGALFIDGGLDLADRIFSETLFKEDNLLLTWKELPLHPLQEDEPNGDRHWVESSPALKKLVRFEEAIGIGFTHMRLLARAFTLRSVGYNNLTLGHNQRLEFLGDTVLQLVASEYLFRHFPDHHEGHLSLLRSSLVNNRTQSIVCDDLGMTDYVIYSDNRGEKTELKTKDKADLLEAFIGSLFVDKDLDHCRVFCNVCFFPRLKDFILNQDWNDPKSQLQQCCLTLRELDGGEPDIPIYKVIECTGPTNTRRYKVAVYFRGERLSSGVGHSIQQAEMAAATNALNERSELFPILIHQKRFLERQQNKRGRSHD